MGEGHSVSFNVPQNSGMKRMILCVVYLATPGIMATERLRNVLIVNYTKCTLQIHNHGSVISINDEDWHGIMANLGSGEKVEIFMTFDHGLVVYMICGESNFEIKPYQAKGKYLKEIH